jgi:hypothetical protein
MYLYIYQYSHNINLTIYKIIYQLEIKNLKLLKEEKI